MINMSPIEKNIGYSVEEYQNLNKELLLTHGAIRTNPSQEDLIKARDLVLRGKNFLDRMPENDLNREGLGRKIGVLENLCKNSQ
jgi:hypothetical protein